MKFATSAVVLATAIMGASAQQVTFPPSFNQTAKEMHCKDAFKTLVNCALGSDFNSASGNWTGTTPNCITNNAADIAKCKGSAASYVNSQPLNIALNQLSRPSYAVAGSITKSGSLNALVGIPKLDSKLRSVNCNVCSKFTKKLLDCMLPVSNAAANPTQSLLTATAACATTLWDQALFDMCLTPPSDTFQPIPTSNGQITYLFTSPVLHIDRLVETCPAIEARTKQNGMSFTKIQKGSFFLLP